MTPHPFARLSVPDLLIAKRFVPDGREPDLTIAPDGQPYLYRWHVVERNREANAYFHIQVASDPERPLHDHPWDNCTVMLAGAYVEVWDETPTLRLTPKLRHLKKGDVQARLAGEAHRLILPKGVPYAMTLFTTGPKVRAWGFWTDTGWKPWEDVTEVTPDGRSVWKEPVV